MSGRKHSRRLQRQTSSKFPIRNVWKNSKSRNKISRKRIRRESLTSQREHEKSEENNYVSNRKNCPLTYLSLFSGIGGFECGIQQIFPNAKCLGYSEINPSSIKVYEEHFPDHVNLGDVRLIKGKVLENLKGKVDLLVGGSPCQNFSNAGDRKGLAGEKSSLLMEYVRILDEIEPKFFILENVRMSKEHQDQISELLGIKPVLINSNIASYQARKRLYWCNFNISSLEKLPPIDGTVSNILLDPGSKEAKEMVHKTIGKRSRGSMEKRINSILRGKPIAQSGWFKIIKREDKSVRTLLKGDACYEWIRQSNSARPPWIIRQIHPIERERLQTFPDGWTSSLSKTQRYEVIGDAVTCKVIALIMEKLKEKICKRP
jgi:site-specific DNA-cytosine methylase